MASWLDPQADKATAAAITAPSSDALSKESRTVLNADLQHAVAARSR
jgi:hypothetical protein